MERVIRFELTTSTLARLRSTPELHPLSTLPDWVRYISALDQVFKKNFRIDPRPSSNGSEMRLHTIWTLPQINEAPNRINTRAYEELSSKPSSG